MTEDKQTHRKKHRISTFLLGVIIGVALIPGAYFTYLLLTNDDGGQDYPLDRKEYVRDSIPPLENIIGLPRMFFDSSLQAIDSSYYWRKWGQLISLNGYREMDSLFLDSIIRKMYFDSLLVAREESKDTIIVENDRLLKSMNLNVPVQKMFLVKEDTSKNNNYVYSETHYSIEMWESPLRFRGYKRQGTHVVLFGILPKNLTAYAQIDNEFYIKENQLWFVISNAETFRGYTPVSSDILLSRLNNVSRHK